MTGAIGAPAFARTARRTELSPAAVEAASAYAPPAFSPIVLAGFVRAAECFLIVAVGALIYTVYLFPDHGFEWHYAIATSAIAALSMVAFQAADIYQVQAFRGHEKQYMRLASAWSVVFLVVITTTKKNKTHKKKKKKKKNKKKKS
jgi:hypothetical protein